MQGPSHFHGAAAAALGRMDPHFALERLAAPPADFGQPHANKGAAVGAGQRPVGGLGLAVVVQDVGA